MPRILTREERAALKQHHINRIREAEADVEVKRGPFDAAKEELTNRIHTAQGDLGKKGYPRSYLLSLASDVGATTRDQHKFEAQRFEDRVDLALPVVGDQLGLFGEAKSETEVDAIASEVDGYRAGRRADKPDVPAEYLMFNQDWMRGYHKGQAENAPKKMLGAKVAAELSAGDADDEGGDSPAETEFDAAAEAQKLKDKGFVPEKPQAPAAAGPRARRSITAGSELRVVG